MLTTNPEDFTNRYTFGTFVREWIVNGVMIQQNARTGRILVRRNYDGVWLIVD